MQGLQVITASLMYLGILFLIAWYGDKQYKRLSKWRPWIYSLSIAVYCTSWSFYGTVGQASANPWAFIPIYLAPILMFTLGWRVIAKLVATANREHITSIADFIAARYGKSQGLAAVITLIAVAGILPYISLQLRGITMGLNLIAPDLPTEFSGLGLDVSFFVVIALAVFTMLFGTRHIDNTEHHRGMMTAIAFESTIKLVAFLVVGIFITSLAVSLPEVKLTDIAYQTYQAPNIPTFIIHLLLTMLAILCLPRQFHTMVVENECEQDLKTARWLFPTYLVLMGLFVLPIAWVGQTLLGDGVSPDSFVISLPKAIGANDIALLAFLGGTSAASGMVIVSTIALAIMLSNDLVMPFLLRRIHLARRQGKPVTKLLLQIRRALIVLLLLGSWGFYQVLGNIHSLSAIGFLSFTAISQFAPALIGGIYWRQGNRKGVYVGLAVGFAIWLMTLMNQAELLLGSVEDNVLVWIMTPPNWLQALKVTDFDWGIILSITLNTLCYVVVSLVTRASLSERLQSAAFVGIPEPNSENMTMYQSRVTVEELQTLASRFVGRQRVQGAFRQYWHSHGIPLPSNQQAPANLIRHTERVLAGVFGASSAKLVLNSALQGRNMQLEDVVTIVDEASELYDFSRGLLQGAIEHIGQGISVIDKQLRLVAWNKRYLELFSFPRGLVQVGRPIEDIIRYNAEQGLCGPGDIEEQVKRRLAFLKQGSAHTSSRLRADGRVIEVQGNPMPNGGFVMSFSDITVFREAEQALKQANENLEERVIKRTEQLQHLNQQLVTATKQSEHESRSKSRFLAAVSHDLMQPLNAARLFASSLNEVTADRECRQLARNIESSLEAAEDLIGDLLDISRLESGKLEANVHGFAINDVLTNLSAEFDALSKQQNIEFQTILSQLWVRSDPKLLRRVIQNFLTNAFRYSPEGKVVLGVRRAGPHIKIEVWDNGMGIEPDKQQEIFQEFKRGTQLRAEQGLGLGLAISKGISHVLGHQITMRSWLGKGSVFAIEIPRCEERPSPKEVSPSLPSTNLNGLKVLCVDNEIDILHGMQSLLERWGCDVRVALNLKASIDAVGQGWLPDVILSDYRLEDEHTGLDVLQHFRALYLEEFLGVIISADRSEAMLSSIDASGFSFLPKPVKPLKLRSMLNQIFVNHPTTVD